MADAALERRFGVSSGAELVHPGKAAPKKNAKSAGSDKPAVPSKTTTQFNAAIQLLSRYIPGEILTLYVAVLATLKAPVAGDNTAHWVAFWVFLAATPIIQWMVYAAKVKDKGKPLPVRPKAWPKWEMIAATIAYVAWAFALPQTPFTVYAWYSAALSGVAAPLFQRETKVA
jgi:hypothetical protein